MALINCSECGNQISSKAKKCPHCGSVSKKCKVKTIVLSVVSFVVVALLFYGLITVVQNYRKQKEIQNYDESVYETVINFHDTFESVDERIRTRNYTSLEGLIETLEKPINDFDNLLINEESEYGQYIKSVKNNIMYTTFKSQYIENDSLDLDYGLTSGGYAYLITIYTEEILKIELPVNNE